MSDSSGLEQTSESEDGRDELSDEEFDFRSHDTVGKRAKVKVKKSKAGVVQIRCKEEQELDMKVEQEVVEHDAPVSEYERRRLERMEANAKFLEKLGMAKIEPTPPRPSNKRKRNSLVADEELRRSSRLLAVGDQPEVFTPERKSPQMARLTPQPPSPARKSPQGARESREISSSDPQEAEELRKISSSEPQEAEESREILSSEPQLPKESTKTPKRIRGRRQSTKKPKPLRKRRPYKERQKKEPMSLMLQQVGGVPKNVTVTSFDKPAVLEVPTNTFQVLVEPKKAPNQTVARKPKYKSIMGLEPSRTDESGIDDVPAVFYGAPDAQRYSCLEVDPSAGYFAKAEYDDRELVGFSMGDGSVIPPMFDPKLEKIYAAAFSPFEMNSLFVTGGYPGRVSVYIPFSHSVRTTGNVVDQAPVMSFKAHDKWISSLCLPKSIRTNLLVTASKDAFVKLWDVNQVDADSNLPICVATTNELHTSGIFGMDVYEDSVATCSKDGSVTISSFEDGTDFLRGINRYKDLGGAVRSVRFSRENPNEFVAGGCDKVLRVFDVNVKDRAVLEIPNAHTRAINSVQYHPYDGNMILSAGSDPDIHMYDVRKASSPLFTLRGHATQQRCIYHPIFVDDGRAVAAAAGAQCRAISLYSTTDGSTISRGVINHRADLLVADPFMDRILVTSGGVATTYGFRRKSY